MGGDSPKEYRSPLKGHGKRRGSKVESRLFQRMPQRTRQKHQRRLLRAVRAVPRTRERAAQTRVLSHGRVGTQFAR